VKKCLGRVSVHGEPVENEPGLPLGYGVILLPVADLALTLPFALMWRKDNNSPLLAKFISEAKSLVERRQKRGGSFA